MKKERKNKKKNQKGITLIALVITVIVLLILAGVSIATLTGDSGLLSKASEAKIMTALGAIKEKIELDKTANLMENKNITVEQLLAEGKIKRTVQSEGENYYMYYTIKPEAYEGMQGLGKGTSATLRDVFLIDDEFHVKYIDKSGKEYGGDIREKILEDETEIRFASKAFSEYVSRISGVTEEEMKFKWMKNQTSLTIDDSSIDTLEDLVFFPNLISLSLSGTQVITLDGVENCTKLTSISITYGLDKEYMALVSLPNLTSFFRIGGNDYDNIIDSLKFCNSIENVTIASSKIDDMNKIGELKDLKTLNLASNLISEIKGLENKSSLTTLSLSSNKITKIKGLENLSNLKALYLFDNQITDITPLSINTSLTDLSLTGNTGIDGNRNNYTGERLEALDKIGEILDRGGQINIDVDKIGLFTNYKTLNLSSQGLTTLEPLEELTSLTFLDLSYNQLTLEDEKSKEILRSMENLKTLNLTGNKITDVTVINNLKNLRSLYISDNINLAEIEDIISNLENLRISTESLKTITNCDINKITKLSIPSSSLTEIPDLSKFTKLTSLNLSGNSAIKNLNSISKLTNLQGLNLTYTNLHGRMIDFSRLTKLTNLDLSNNTLWTEDLENLKALKNNTNLTISLSNNSIIDASSLLALDTSCKIDLRNNVNLSQESKDTLKARFGSNVSF